MEETRNNNCTDALDEQIVRIELFDSTSLMLRLPCSLKLARLVPSELVGESKALFGFTDDCQYIIEEASTIKTTTTKSLSTTYYTHELQLSVVAAHQEARRLVEELDGQPLYMLATVRSGRRYVIYPFENGSQIGIDENGISNNTCNIKLSFCSVNNKVFVKE